MNHDFKRDFHDCPLEYPWSIDIPKGMAAYSYFPKGEGKPVYLIRFSCTLI
jgi:hypothetical protein